MSIAYNEYLLPPVINKRYRYTAHKETENAYQNSPFQMAQGCTLVWGISEKVTGNLVGEILKTVLQLWL